jgi:hypothetical protein
MGGGVNLLMSHGCRRSDKSAPQSEMPTGGNSQQGDEWTTRELDTSPCLRTAAAPRKSAFTLPLDVRPSFHGHATPAVDSDRKAPASCRDKGIRRAHRMEGTVAAQLSEGLTSMKFCRIKCEIA